MIFQEDCSSQIPALRTLINLGYQYLSQEEVMAQRYDRTSNVLLEPILKEQLAKINEIRVSSTHTEKFTQSNIDEDVLRLKEIPLEQGYLSATQHIYELLTLGTTLDQTIEGNRREYTLQFIDWKNPNNNVFHIAEEFSVITTDGKSELRPDIVLFVNGIPLSVIECKREDMDTPIKQAISQHYRNQQGDRIRPLYVYSQILLSCAVSEAKYGTNYTPENFWSTWKEKEIDAERMQAIKNVVPAEEIRKKIMARRQASKFFGKEQAEHIHNRLTKDFTLTVQDSLLISIASPERLLDLSNNFILYDNGIKKIARYQQYFAVKNAMKRIKAFSPPSLALPPEGEGSNDISVVQTSGSFPEGEGSEGVVGEGSMDKSVSYRGNLYFSGLLKEARELRKNQTPAEEILWQLLRNRKLNNLKFRRQHQIGHYIVDFYCHEKKLIVELDGAVHDIPERQKHDQKRDKQLNSLGFHILRFPNEKVINDTESVLKQIVEFTFSTPLKRNLAGRDILHSPSGRGAGGEGTPSQRGGVVWHTQGSGKSLTMALMAEAIAKDKTIKNPKIILVTDRTDLDKQITGTFINVGLEVLNAKTGRDLVEVLESNTDAVITTIINKFETAVSSIKEPLESNSIFVLIDEGHRTQHGTFNINMQKTMPNACYIAFTGTPLFKKDKSTMQRFGTMIDQYTVRQAVEDGAVLPLIYEGRFTDQKVNEEVIDNFFQMVSEDLSEYERADLKKKFSQRSHIADADQNIYSIAWDITKHYQQNFQGTGLKGQIVCSSKRTAVKYFDYMQQIGRVSVALIMSPPDDREGEDSAYQGTSDSVKKFWAAMMDQHTNSVRYEENIIAQFKHEEHPEIIIVVDKLLTGFDAPRNTVLYLTRKLRGHTLLQAIARVNRLYPDKDYGYIIDYAGIVEELDDALLTYSDMEEFDDKDLEGTLVSIMDEIGKLDPAHQELLEIFKQISNKEDTELYQQTLREKDVRDDFYKRLANFARILKLALSSIDFHNKTSESKIKKYKSDLKFFMNLRTAVAQRFSDKIDYKVYEGQIQKLIDQHITTQDIQPLTELVNIFDEDAFQREVEKTIGEAAKADKIASRTSKHISEKMDEDPVFYRKFSQLIQQTINDFYNERISELEYLNKIEDISNKVKSRTDSEIPEKIRHNPTASAYYGIVQSFYKDKGVNTSEYEDLLANASLQIEEIIGARKVVNWQNNQDVLKKMVLNIGDYIYDEIGEEIGMKINFSDIDEIAENIVSTAKARG